MGEVRSSAEFVRHLVVELSRFTGMRGAVVTEALYSAGFPEDHLPSRSAADHLTGTKAAIGWKAQLARDELDVAMAVLFLRTKYSNGRPGGLLAMWHPTTRWLFVRLTGPRKAVEPDFHRWIDRKLLEGAERYARLRGMVDQQKEEVAGAGSCSPKERSDHLPEVDLDHLPKIIVLSDWLREDGYEPNFSEWMFEPQVLKKEDGGDHSSYIFELADLPALDPHEFIRHIVDGYNFADFLFTIGRRGVRRRAAEPRPSVPARMGIAGNKGRRWRNLLRMPVFGEGRTKRGPFESSRRKLTVID